MLKAHSMTHVLSMTRTAHPGLYVAARALKLEVLACVQGQSEHSMRHGDALLAKLLALQKLPDAKSALGEGAGKRLRTSSLQFITVAACPDQPVRMGDVAVKPE